MDEDTEGTTSDPGGYPAPVVGSFVWHPQPEKPSQERLIRSVAGEIGWFLLGLAAIEAVVAPFAVPVGSALTSHSTAYFGALTDVFNLFIVGPAVMLAFAVIAFVRADWIFLAYPPAAFFMVGPAIQQTAAVSALTTMFPFKIHDLHSTNQDFAAAMVAYAVVYTLEHTISKMVARGRFKTHAQLPPRGLIIATQASILVASALLCLAAPGWAGHVQADNQLDRRSVRMPRTGDFAALSEAVNLTGEFSLYYLGRTKQDNGSYNMRDTVTYSIIGQGSTTDTRTVCGGQVRLAGSTKVFTVRYQKTSNGLEFGSYEAPRSTYQTHKSLAYTEYHNCFVLDGKKYDVVRSSRHGSAYLKAHPAADIVAAFLNAKSYPNCAELSQTCSEADIAQAKKVDRTIIEAPTDYEPTINPSPYVKVASLAIKEWGIRIPLSKEAKGLYYLPGSPSNSMASFGRASKSGKDCHVGVKRGVKGAGLAYIVRTLKVPSDEWSRPAGMQIPYKQVGNYMYHIETKMNARSCLGGGAVAGFASSLDWSTLNITPL